MCIDENRCLNVKHAVEFARGEAGDAPPEGLALAGAEGKLGKAEGVARGVEARTADKPAVKAEDVVGLPEEELARLDGEGGLGGVGEGERKALPFQRQPYPRGVDGGQTVGRELILLYKGERGGRIGDERLGGRRVGPTTSLAEGLADRIRVCGGIDARGIERPVGARLSKDVEAAGEGEGGLEGGGERGRPGSR